MELLLSVFMSFGLVADSELKVGDKICVMHDTIAVRDGQVLDKDVEAGSCCDIKAIDGDWIEIVIGEKPLRVRKDFVLPIDKAIEYWNAAIIRQPKEPDFYRSRGRCFYLLEKYDAALNDYQHCVALAPADAISHFRIASIQKISKRYKEASEASTLAIHFAPKDGRAFCLRGEVYFITKDLDRALDDVNQSIEMSPEYRRPYYIRAAIHQLRNEYVSAIKYFGDILESEPNGSKGQIFAARASCYIQLELYEQAMADLDKAIEFNRSSVDLFTMRAECRRLLNDFSGAVSDATCALRINENSPQIYLIRAKALESLGKTDDAIRDYERILKQSTDKKLLLTVYVNKSNLLGSAERWMESIIDLDRAIKIAPGIAELYSMRGRNYFQIKDFEKAAIDIERSLSLNPRSLVCLMNAAVFLSSSDNKELGHLKKAADLATTACEVSQWRDRRSVALLARICELAGKIELAEKYNKMANELPMQATLESRNIQKIFEDPSNFAAK